MATHSAGAAAAPYRTAAEMDEDEASMLITGMFRRRVARKRILMMASAVYEKAYDESTGCFFYYNKRTQTSVWDKPKVLGGADIELTPRSKAALAASATASRASSPSAGEGKDHSTEGKDGGHDHKEAYGENDSAGGGTSRSRRSGAGALALPTGRSLESHFTQSSVVSLEGFLARHGLLQYQDALEEDGFEDMESLLGIEPVDMDALGMRTGHKRKLLRAIREIDMTPRGDGYGGALVPAGAGAGAGASGHGRPPRSSKDHRNSLAAKLKLDLGGAQPTRTTAVRRASALSGAGSRRKSVYSDDRGAASHRSGRMHNAGDAGSNDGDTIDADDIEMNLETIFEGDGITFPQEGQVVRCHYKAFFDDGREFEGSRKRGRAFQFKLGVGQVVEAWDIAISQMSKGQRARFTAPPELAYGVEGRPPIIPPNATLTFEVELIDFFEPEVELTPREYYEDDADGPDSD